MSLFFYITGKTIFRRPFLKSSHTSAYNPNARRAYEKSQHADDLEVSFVSLTRFSSQTSACDRGVCRTYKKAQNAEKIGARLWHQTLNARLIHAWDTLPKQYILNSERACSMHWRALNARQTHPKCSQSTCNARRTYSNRADTRPRHAELLEKNNHV